MTNIYIYIYNNIYIYIYIYICFFFGGGRYYNSSIVGPETLF